MDQNSQINKELAVKLCNSIELVFNMSIELKSVEIDKYNNLLEHFEFISDFFKVKDQLGVLLLCYFINRRLVKGKSSITLNELMNAFECNLVNSISINEQLEYFRKTKKRLRKTAIHIIKNNKITTRETDRASRINYWATQLGK